MRRVVQLLAMTALVLALAPLRAQVFNMERDRVQMAPLGGLMRFHTGDNPLWSQPGFDDSTWPLISSERDWSQQGYKDYSGFAWYRFKVILPPDRGQLSLYLPKIRTSYQVFADGKLVGSFGGLPPHAAIYSLHQHLVLLPQSQTGEMEIAIRVWHWPHWAIDYGGGLSAPPRIGDADQLRDWMALQDKNTFWELSAQNFLALLNFLYGVAGFTLFFLRPKERLYFWYGLTGFLFCSWSLMNAFEVFHDMPVIASEALKSGVSDAGFFTFLVFVWMLMGSRRVIWIWIGIVYVALSGVMWTLSMLLNLPVPVDNFILAALNILVTGIPLAMLAQGVRRREPDARLLLLPVAFNTLANWMNGVLGTIHTAGHPWVEPYLKLWESTFNWPFPFDLYDLSILILLFAILGVVVLRFARSRHEEEQMKNELEAARIVQQVLIPDAIPAVPGFRIESVYKPASEVGGDFFQIVSLSSGGALIVIGDVSGKGMPAAMTVSLLVGTFRTLAHYTQSPSEILHAMNQRMLARSNNGFTTCLVLRVGPDGALTAANAGHLAPHVNGKEITIDNGLPLGLSSSTAYPEAILQLAPNAQLTLLTDGVVEARNPTGELFGFDRTAALSTRPAEEIARAAQQFGQEDDITVLTLRRLPAPQHVEALSPAP